MESKTPSQEFDERLIEEGFSIFDLTTEQMSRVSQIMREISEKYDNPNQ